MLQLRKDGFLALLARVTLLLLEDSHLPLDYNRLSDNR
jgi:hypothetical protein